MWIKLEPGLESAAREIASLRAAAVDREATLQQLESRLGELQTEHQRELACLTAEREELSAVAAAGNQRAAALEAAVAERDREIARLHAAVAERDRETARLHAAGAERDRSTALILGSRSWRYTSPLRALARLAPPRCLKP